MDANRWKSIEELIGASLNEPAGRRATYLEASAAQAGITSVEILEVCTAMLAVELDPTPNWGASAMDEPTAEQAPAALAGIEAFEILEQLGAGGMGVVYRARQHGAVAREVALKICPAQPSAHLRQRLQQERRTLARLNHPNIAQMLEAGDSPNGQPYFAMELVAGGAPISSYCDRCELSLSERVSLFLQVCAGVQYAHQQGVLHRDLKPGNILVLGTAAQARVKIIDFGIAKLLEDTEHEAESVLPASEPMDMTGRAILGTPNYMSPERLRLTSAEVDTRSDIYSLGVLLHEMLVGQPPCCRQAGESIADYRERRGAQRLPTLSEAWEALDAARQQPLAAQRRLSRVQMQRTLRGDLHWIVDKALADDPEQRYASASELASDLQRHLEQRAVAAAPPSARYQFGRFVRRHRWPVVISGAVFVALLVAFGLRGLEAARANAATVKAQQSQAETERALRFLGNLFVAADPAEHLGQPVDAGELLRRGAAQLADGELEENPLVRARLLRAIAEVQWRRGDAPTALTLAEQALQLTQQAAPDDRELMANCLHLVGTLHSEVSNYPQAEQMLREALRLREAEFGPSAGPTLATLNNIGAIYEETNRYAEAVASHEQLLQRLRSASGDRELDIARALSNLSVPLRRLERFEESEAAQRQALEIHQRRLDASHPNIALDWQNLGDLARERERYDESLLAYREAERRYRAVVGDQHYDLARTLNGIGNTYKATGRWQEAEEHFLDALAIYDRHGSRLAGYPLANLALIALDQRDWPLLGERSTAFLERFPDDFNDPSQWAEMRCLQARVHADPDAAERIADALEKLGMSATDVHSRARCLLAGIAVADLRGDSAMAEQHAAALLEFEPNHPSLRWATFELRLRLAQQAAGSEQLTQARALSESLLLDWPAELPANHGIVREARELISALP